MSEILTKLGELEKQLKAHMKDRSESQRISDSVRERTRQLEAELSKKNDRISELEEGLKVLKTAGSIQGNGADVAEAKGRISEMVREIDKCIALLNS